MGLISDKDVQCFLYLVVSTLNSEKERTNSSFFRKNKNISSLPEVFCKKGVLRSFAKFEGKHLCQGLFFEKVAGLRPFLTSDGCFCKSNTQLTTKLIAIN